MSCWFLGTGASTHAISNLSQPAAFRPSRDKRKTPRRRLQSSVKRKMARAFGLPALRRDPKPGVSHDGSQEFVLGTGAVLTTMVCSCLFVRDLQRCSLFGLSHRPAAVAVSLDWVAALRSWIWGEEIPSTAKTIFFVGSLQFLSRASFIFGTAKKRWLRYLIVDYVSSEDASMAGLGASGFVARGFIGWACEGGRGAESTCR